MENTPLIVGLVIVGLILMVVLGAFMLYGALWVRAWLARCRVPLFTIVGMRLRKVNPQVIIDARINMTKSGLVGDTELLESHYLAGGNVAKVARAMIAASKANFELPWERACAIDLAGRDILDAVRTSVNPKVIDCPSAHSGTRTIDGVAKDGIQLNVRARVTVRACLERLVGGATEETIIARVGEGIVSGIGSAESHKTVLERPEGISKLVLDKGLDAGTAFEILSIDIADISVGHNIGAKLQADQAEADKVVAQAKAEERRAMAVAREKEMEALTQENRAKVVLAETEIPKAMASAFREGNLGIMDYYFMRNIQADTSMRSAIGGGDAGGEGGEGAAGESGAIVDTDDIVKAVCVITFILFSFAEPVLRKIAQALNAGNEDAGGATRTRARRSEPTPFEKLQKLLEEEEGQPQQRPPPRRPEPRPRPAQRQARPAARRARPPRPRRAPAPPAAPTAAPLPFSAQPTYKSRPSHVMPSGSGAPLHDWNAPARGRRRRARANPSQLPGLARLTDMQRAIVLSEVLGPPPSVQRYVSRFQQLQQQPEPGAPGAPPAFATAPSPDPTQRPTATGPIALRAIDMLAPPSQRRAQAAARKERRLAADPATAETPPAGASAPAPAAPPEPKATTEPTPQKTTTPEPTTPEPHTPRERPAAVPADQTAEQMPESPASGAPPPAAEPAPAPPAPAAPEESPEPTEAPSAPEAAPSAPEGPAPPVEPTPPQPTPPPEPQRGADGEAEPDDDAASPDDERAD